MRDELQWKCKGVCTETKVENVKRRMKRSKRKSRREKELLLVIVLPIILQSQKII